MIDKYLVGLDDYPEDKAKDILILKDDFNAIKV